MLVYCRAGVDRTDILIALTGTWLGIHHEQVLADYLASGQLVQARRLNLAFKSVNNIEQGGAAGCRFYCLSTEREGDKDLHVRECLLGNHFLEIDSVFFHAIPYSHAVYA